MVNDKAIYNNAKEAWDSFYEETIVGENLSELEILRIKLTFYAGVVCGLSVIKWKDNDIYTKEDIYTEIETLKNECMKTCVDTTIELLKSILRD